MAATLAKLENLRLRDTWQQLLRIDDADGIDATLEKVVDGDSVECPLYLSSTNVQIKPTTDATDTFEIVDADDTACLTVNTSYNSVSVGHTNSIIGNNTLVVGNGITALGGADNSLVVGDGAECYGSNSIVVGENATSENAMNTVVLGKDTLAKGQSTIAIGQDCQSGWGWGITGSVAIGKGSVAGASFSVAIGNANIATTQGAIAIGDHSESGGAYSVTIGSYINTSAPYSIAIGNSLTASEDYAIAMGSNSVASGLSSIAFGQSTLASGRLSRSMGDNTIASGLRSKADGFSSKALGKFSRADGNRAYADKRGQRAWQTTFITGATNYGTAQESRYMLHATTTDDTQTEMFLDNEGTSERMTIASDSTWLFHIRIVARQTNADDVSAGYELKGVIDNNAGTTALASSLTKVEIGEDVAGWDVTAVADTTNDALVVKVTGAIGDSVNWVGFVNTVETIG